MLRDILTAHWPAYRARFGRLIPAEQRAAGAHLSFLQALISTGLQPGVRGPAAAKPFQRLCFPACGKTVETVSRYHGQHHPAEAGC